MNVEKLLERALNNHFLSVDEGLFLYENAPIADLIFVADELRKQKTDNSGVVGWIIDRNVNITNYCIAQCEFCNFYRKLNDPDGYITTEAEYIEKIEALFRLGGDQLLLQGGLHPKLRLDFYTSLFGRLKQLFPTLKLHALGPAEIHHIARIEKKSYRYVLEKLIDAGLDSLPGAGAEILSDRVRSEISKGKCTATQWLDVMRQAHILGMVTSATMMFGHIETKRERIEHLIAIRDLQAEKPVNKPGFLSFIPWPFQDKDTQLALRKNVQNNTTASDYVRLIAISRILLPNVTNIQASWLTVGVPTAQLALHAGANDFGSIMIEEHVVSAAGSKYWLDTTQIQNAIKDAGFIPYMRNQKFEYQINNKEKSEIIKT